MHVTIMLIDVQAYLGWLDGREYGADALKQYEQALGLQRVLLAHADRTAADAPLDELDANLATLAACRGAARAAVYWVRAGAFDSNAQVMAGAMQREPFVAAMFCPDLHGYTLADVERLTPYLAVLAELGRPALVRCGPETPLHPDQVYALGRRWPRLNLVLLNALPTVGRHALFSALQHAARRGEGRIFLDTGHADVDAIRCAVDALGADHVLFGSDACSVGSGHAAGVRALLDELQRVLWPEVYAAVCRDNATRVFGLSTPAPA